MSRTVEFEYDLEDGVHGKVLIEATMLPPEQDVGLMSWYVDDLTITDQYGSDIPETEVSVLMLERIKDRASETAHEMDDDTPESYQDE